MSSHANVRARRRLAGAVALAMLLCSAAPAATVVAAPRGETVRAVIDGRPIGLADVPSLQCQDVALPEIQCFRTAAERDASLLAGTTAVTVYDYANLGGGSMAITQDLNSLAPYGWDNRVSSMRVSTTSYGFFYTGLNKTGDYYLFCCAQTYNSLGAYDNTFSSVDVPG